MMANGSRRKPRYFIALYLLPALIIYTVFMALPLFMSLRVSLFDWPGIGEMRFVGLANFQKLFFRAPFNERFFTALINNVKFFGMTMLVQNALALVLAILLTRKLRGANFYRTVFFAPTTLSVVIVGYIWTMMLNPNWGAINRLFQAVGLGFLARPWLGDPGTALWSVAVANAWQYIGLPMMIFVAGIQGIPDQVFEAARVDGAGEWRILTRITLPLLLPVIGMITVLTLVGNFSAFEIVYSMEGSLAGPAYATDILGTLFYRTAFSSLSGAPPEMGLGAAIATVMFVIIGAAVLIWLYFDQRQAGAE